MKSNKFLLSIAAGLLIASTSQAGTISCGSATITDDQMEGQLAMQILEQCGEPTSRDGDNWLYDRSDVGEGLYILHFNDSGKLESIEEEDLIEE